MSKIESAQIQGRQTIGILPQHLNDETSFYMASVHYGIPLAGETASCWSPAGQLVAYGLGWTPNQAQEDAHLVADKCEEHGIRVGMPMIVERRYVNVVVSLADGRFPFVMSRDLRPTSQVSLPSVITMVGEMFSQYTYEVAVKHFQNTKRALADMARTTIHVE